MFNYILQKYTQKQASLLEAGLCPHFLCLPYFWHSILDLSVNAKAVIVNLAMFYLQRNYSKTMNQYFKVHALQ